MAVVGRKPKPEDQRRNRNTPAHDWIEVLDEPYSGPKPSLGRAPARTRQWWEAISSMPHCSLWTVTDWQFALDTALVHAAMVRGHKPSAAELRVREKQMGTTLDALRDLRIRYVDVAAPEEESGVTAIDEYRRMLKA